MARKDKQHVAILGIVVAAVVALYIYYDGEAPKYSYSFADSDGRYPFRTL